MKKNLDDSGRLWRLVMAFVVLFFSWWLSSWILLAISLFIFYEAIAGWCIVYQILGKNSCPLE